MAEPIKTFRDFIAWQRARSLTVQVYRYSNDLPRHQIFGLTSQMRRASASIGLNITEGYGLGTTDQFLKHLRQARASCMEVDAAIDLAVAVYDLRPSEQLLGLIAETDRVIQGLIRSLEAKKQG